MEHEQSYGLWRIVTGCLSAILTAWVQEKIADPTHHPGGQTSKGRDGAEGWKVVCQNLTSNSPASIHPMGFY